MELILLILPMKDNELDITSHIFLYNEFVHKMEKIMVI